MLITASIVTYKTPPEELTQCITTLIANDLRKIFVIDNSPTNALSKICATYPEVTYRYNNENLGYGRAHNIAIRESKTMGAQYHLVLNSDIAFAPNTIQQIVAYMENNEDVAQLCPDIVYPNGQTQFLGRLLPTPMQLIFRRFLPKSFTKKTNSIYQLEFFDRKTPCNIPNLSGCFMFFRVSSFEKVGLFDERFFMYGEDIDITRRMHAHYRTMYWPGVTITHSYRAESYKSIKMLWVHAYNIVKYFNKWGWFVDTQRTEWNQALLKKLRK